MWGINYEVFREKIIKKGGLLDVVKRVKEEGLIGYILFFFYDKLENMIKIIDEGEVFEIVFC